MGLLDKIANEFFANTSGSAPKAATEPLPVASQAASVATFNAAGVAAGVAEQVAAACDTANNHQNALPPRCGVAEEDLSQLSRFDRERILDDRWRREMAWVAFEPYGVELGWYEPDAEWRKFISQMRLWSAAVAKSRF